MATLREKLASLLSEDDDDENEQETKDETPAEDNEEVAALKARIAELEASNGKDEDKAEQGQSDETKAEAKETETEPEAEKAPNRSNTPSFTGKKSQDDDGAVSRGGGPGKSYI